MIDTGKKLFGYPIHVCEQGESLGGDKNLPPVKKLDSVEKLGDCCVIAIEDVANEQFLENFQKRLRRECEP